MTVSHHFSRRGMLFMPLFFPMALSACKERHEVIRLSGLTMGTVYSIVVVDQTGGLTASDVQIAVDKALDDVDLRMSNWRSDSEISRFNAYRSDEPMWVSSELSELMHTAQHVHYASLGHFDTTVGPLIELWGFGSSGARELPSEDDIAERLSSSGHDHSIQVSQGALRKKTSNATVYLSGIGKGFGADHVSRAIEALGITDYMVEIGGDIYASGLNPDGVPWQIGIETPNPADKRLAGVVGLGNMGLATSGDYRNYFEVGGQRFSHLIDPTTGHPVTHKTASATVLAGSAKLADAWSTAMLILGQERGMEIAAAHGIAVQFVEYGKSSGKHDFRTYSSPEFTALTT